MQAQPPARPDLKALKALVGVMGVLIVLGTAVVVAVVAQRLYARPAATSTGVAARAPGAAPFLLPTGTHIAGIAAAGGAIAVWTSGPAGDQLLLINPASGAVSRVIAAPR